MEWLVSFLSIPETKMKFCLAREAYAMFPNEVDQSHIDPPSLKLLQTIYHLLIKSIYVAICIFLHMIRLFKS